MLICRGTEKQDSSKEATLAEVCSDIRNISQVAETELAYCETDWTKNTRHIFFILVVDVAGGKEAEGV